MEALTDTDQQWAEMQERLIGENGEEILAAMTENAIALNAQLRETFDELTRRGERKIARRIIRALLLNIESEVWTGIRYNAEGSTDGE